MWEQLPHELQEVVLKQLFVPDSTGFIEPRHWKCVCNRQFLRAATELRRRLRCYERARVLGWCRHHTDRSFYAFIREVTQIGVDHARLRHSTSGFPHAIWLNLITRIHDMINEEWATQRGCARLQRLWGTLGARSSVFHRSVAVETIVDAKLCEDDLKAAITFMDSLFGYLHQYGVFAPGSSIAHLRVREVLIARLDEVARNGPRGLNVGAA
ncbi:MAG: hypothetical protein CMI29_01510 [Opitutae bacterium]|nr:hypothetical protein [Opitutae bacterium]|tara:strand:+ start:349 stop:984 length:636 start_codon:yes stop_codon:yes gene_type:complete